MEGPTRGYTQFTDKVLRVIPHFVVLSWLWICSFTWTPTLVLDFWDWNCSFDLRRVAKLRKQKQNKEKKYHDTFMGWGRKLPQWSYNSPKPPNNSSSLCQKGLVSRNQLCLGGQRDTSVVRKMCFDLAIRISAIK